MAWITTKDGRKVNTDWFEDKPIVSKYSGDSITLQMALNSWAKNANGIKAASIGTKYDGSVFGKVALNDEAKAEQITAFVKGHKTLVPIYRGVQNLSDEDYKRYTKVGADVSEKGLSSWTTDKGVATGHGRLGKGITFIKTSPTDNARGIGNRVGTDIENEVIGLDVLGKVKKVEKDKYTTYVYLE